MVFSVKKGGDMMQNNNENNINLKERIKSLRNKITEEELAGASAKQLAKYLVQIDELKALMLVASTKESLQKEKTEMMILKNKKIKIKIKEGNYR